MRFYIGPMSKNVVDTVIEFAEKNSILMTLIPSRCQIEYDGGYVNNWTTKTFTEYIHSKSTKILLKRDHGGPGQGTYDDDGFESLKHDCVYFDLIHIDPWKKYPKFEDGLQWTINMITYCYNLNNTLRYEIATEEGIRKFEVDELEKLILSLQERLSPEIYNQIAYIVIQCGTRLSEKNNIGTFDKDKLVSMIALANKYNLIAKEHNGDWVSYESIHEKTKCGLNNINIAPEFGEIESRIILDNIRDNIDYFNTFFKVCLDSEKWVKWVSNDFDPYKNKEKLILICGHYVLSHPSIINIKLTIPNIDEKIKKAISDKLQELQEFI
jgi:hypothetical protein